MVAFARYVGIDYSGAKMPTSSLKGLRVYVAEGDALPAEVKPAPSSRKYWSRKGIAEWLVERLSEDVPTLVGIDHGFSFPLAYFDAHGISHDWDMFLEDFYRYWPTHGDRIRVDDVRKGDVGNYAARSGNTRWRRLTEIRSGSAKSCFHFDVQGSVAKSTHSGIPWLRFIRHQLGARVHFWPFDGWVPPAGIPVIAEVYPRLWNRKFDPDPEWMGDQHDAYSIAAWFSLADQRGGLKAMFAPALTQEERETANLEGWILGVR